MIKKISLSVLLLISLLFLNTSCDDYLDVNNNVDGPTYIDGYLYLAGIEQSYQGMYYDVRATGPLTQMMSVTNKTSTGTSFQSFASNYYPNASDNGGELWRMVYWLQGVNLENMINQSVANSNWTLAGIGYAIKAFSWDQLTKINGEAPMKEAFEKNRFSFDYDYQYDIYPQVRKWAYLAIKYLQMEDKSIYGTTISANDYIYSGDKAKWIKFAYGVLARNFISLSCKSDFVTAGYADSVIYCAGLSFASISDDATLSVAGGGATAKLSAYNNFWGTNRLNLSYDFLQHEYAVQVMTGTVPQYDETTGNKISSAVNAYYPYELAAKQIICDTAMFTATGHYDPRVAVKLGTTDDPNYNNTTNIKLIKKRKYYGGSFTSAVGSIGTAPSFYGRTDISSYTGTVHDGAGRWLYRDDAPYILMTYSEMCFDVAEAYWKKAMKTEALAAFKLGVKADLDFSAKYISVGTTGYAIGGDKIAKSTFTTAAAEYAAGPFVDGLAEADFTLSHIMMQKWVALYPWGACEAWVDMRKYQYDISYTGGYPSSGNGWDISSVNQKWDSDDSKVYKGFFLAPAQVQGRKTTYNSLNLGSPCYRLRPRYNSEYMWNIPALQGLKPIAGTATNYQCSIPWFAYPGDMPTSK
jgi:hypothetical protein